MHQEIDEKKIYFKLQTIESHLVNLILPLQTINKLESLTRNSIQIDDRKLISTLNMFRESVCELIGLIKSEEYYKYIEAIKSSKEELNTILNEFKSSINDHKQTLYEIKYIGKRVNEIKEDLQDIKKIGVKNCIEVKVINEEKNKQLSSGLTKQMAYDKIKSVLKPFEAEIFFSAWGLGHKLKTYIQLSKEFSFSAGYIGQVARQALRKVLIKVPIEYIQATENPTLIRNAEEWGS